MKHCEAMIQVRGLTWTRCGMSPTELHHKLTRARGGELLDAVGEDYHLTNLCHGHHMWAHDSAYGISHGLLLEGYVISGEDDWPEYIGPDKYLSVKYPTKEQ